MFSITCVTWKNQSETINKQKDNPSTLLVFSYSKDYRYITKPKLKMRANEVPLLIQTRSRIKAHERSVLKMAAKNGIAKQ